MNVTYEMADILLRILQILLIPFVLWIWREFAKLGRESRRLEREWLEWKAEMPLQYVRREDYVRNQTVIEAKIDAIAVRLENWQLREKERA